MKKGIITLIVIVIILVIGGGTYMFFNNKNKSVEVNDDKVVTETNQDYFVKNVKLNSGYEMPVLGIGMFRLSNSEAENSVYYALKDGYRLIDTARIYGNEEGVGRGIKKSGVPREEIFITTKLWTDDYDNADEAIDASLKRLGVDYIDLMILHHSASNDVEAYKALERAVKAGKLKSIGISNYYTKEEFDRLASQVEIKPALLQNENHPYHQMTELKDYISEKYGTVLESWYPLGGRGHTQELFNDEVISNIANNHNKTSAQVILRWHIQAGFITIPGSSNPDHIAENYNIFDFELTNDEMKQIESLNKNERNSTY